MSPLQQAGDTPQHAIVLTPLVWKKAVKGYKNKRGSTFESRLREVLQATAKAHRQHPQAQQVHFDLYPLLERRFRLKLVLNLVNPIHGPPYLLLSLKEESNA
ncbi:hypothetical protein NLK61_00065 [Pseudomonas fuscovaginae UPB0736]|uniref:hypothetical protein n=1 Tax=Pseudomonas asplenii TaxID=53407 RepID=UPI000287F403|nr:MULTISPECIES: hypothetical protein [Pseudomonas]UUQ65083.1 hypothetical protein NLK61_00065 [Pseudomonas fuscovaginae UPB0736]UZE31696.1 hypothetical protein LOY63_13560 [Pseudomonas asplenii]